MTNSLAFSTQFAVSSDVLTDATTGAVNRRALGRAPCFSDLLVGISEGTMPVRQLQCADLGAQRSTEGVPTDGPLPAGEMGGLSDLQASLAQSKMEASRSEITRVIPVDLVVAYAKSAGRKEADSVLLNLLDDLKAELNIISITDRMSMICDATTLDSRAGDSRSGVVLKLDVGDSSVAVPIEVADSAVSVLEETDQQRRMSYRLRVIDDTRLILTEPDKDTTRPIELPERVYRITSRPEVSVRQVVVIADPDAFIRRFMPEFKFSSWCQTRVAGTVGRDLSGSADSPVTGCEIGTPNRSHRERDPETMSCDRRLHPDSRRDDSAPRLGKIDIQRLSREFGPTADRLQEFRECFAIQEHDIGSLELPFKSGTARTLANQLAVDLKDPANRALPDAARFTVHLPDTGLKVTEVSSFRVTLQPESLGNVKVHLVMVEDHLNARLTVESVAARQAVEANIPVLKETLEQYGIRVEHFSVDVAHGGDSQRRQDFRRNAQLAKQDNESFVLEAEEQLYGTLESNWTAPAGRQSGIINLVA